MFPVQKVYIIVCCDYVSTTCCMPCVVYTHIGNLAVIVGLSYMICDLSLRYIFDKCFLNGFVSAVLKNH